MKPFMTGNAFCHLTVVEASTKTKLYFFVDYNFLLFPHWVNAEWEIRKFISFKAMEQMVSHFTLFKNQF